MEGSNYDDSVKGKYVHISAYKKTSVPFKYSTYKVTKSKFIFLQLNFIFFITKALCIYFILFLVFI